MGNGPMMGDGPMMGNGPMMEESACVDGSCGTCSDCCLVPCGGFAWPRGNLEGFIGTQGFTGPANRPDGSGSFGFNEGLNWGMPLPAFGCMGAQLGFRATQSNLSGADFSNDTRNQMFVTGGLFRRVDVGLQGGIVIDYLSESWYHDLDLTKLRGEISWAFCGTHDLGFWFSGATKTSTIVSGVPDAQTPDEIWEGTDVYAFFYRRHFGGCLPGDARVLAGWSGDSDGLIALEGRLPLDDRWWLEGSAWYLIPSEGTGNGFDAGHTQESWNIGINLVFSLDRLLGHGVNPYYRPLFNVADNGSFMFDRR
jgi:hypothetical protein